MKELQSANNNKIKNSWRVKKMASKDSNEWDEIMERVTQKMENADPASQKYKYLIGILDVEIKEYEKKNPEIERKLQEYRDSSYTKLQETKDEEEIDRRERENMAETIKDEVKDGINDEEREYIFYLTTEFKKRTKTTVPTITEFGDMIQFLNEQETHEQAAHVQRKRIILLIQKYQDRIAQLQKRAFQRTKEFKEHMKSRHGWN